MPADAAKKASIESQEEASVWKYSILNITALP